jgi:hypothetical protein
MLYYVAESFDGCQTMSAEIKSLRTTLLTQPSGKSYRENSEKRCWLLTYSEKQCCLIMYSEKRC